LLEVVVGGDSRLADLGVEIDAIGMTGVVIGTTSIIGSFSLIFIFGLRCKEVSKREVKNFCCFHISLMKYSRRRYIPKYIL